jgi:exo-beta-1,3-glucanase (GH17 family)
MNSVPATLVAYNPSGYDPRRPLPADGYPAAEVRADLAALRPGFDGLILYAYQPGLTPSIIALAVELGYRAVLFGIWDPKSAVERNGVAALVAQHHDRLAFAVALGNEGINDNRYELADLHAAAGDLARRLPSDVHLPVTTSEPAGDYGWVPLRAFGDFLAPNIHPAVDRGDLTPGAAAAWVRAKAIAIARAAGKPVLVKETGFPHGGAAGLDPARQHAFWAAYVRPGLTEVADRPGASTSFAAAFEAFDSPWKSDILGSPSESRWGLLAVDRTPYPAFGVWSALRASR